MNGTFNVIYGSPECLLSVSIWRSIFQCQTFTEMLVGVAIDEAHLYSSMVSFLSNYLFFREIINWLFELILPTCREKQTVLQTKLAVFCNNIA